MIKITRKSFAKSKKPKPLKRGPKLKTKQCIICGKMYLPKVKCRSKYCGFECLDKSDNKKYIKNILQNRYIRHK